MMLLAQTAWAQKSVYLPLEWRYPKQYLGTDSLIYAEEDPDHEYTWSKTRSQETDNVIVFWDKGYGSTNPTNASGSYQVDIDDLLEKAEEFYELEVSTLGFVDPETSNLAKYKVMILMNHTTTWTCYGGGYDYQVPALWLSPSTCQPVGQSVAHEVGHSFHYMCYAEASEHGTLDDVETGFHSAIGDGSVTWEQTAQWQSLQSYPSLMYDQSISIFRDSHNYAFTHEWHRYQSYWFMYYLCQYYDDIKTVANVWNQPETEPVDFNEALMDLKGLSVEDLYRLYFDYACHLVTWDLDVCEDYRDEYIGDFSYKCSLTDDSAYQVALASCPQSTGFNVIPLEVPAGGTTVTTEFTALKARALLADADPGEFLNGSSEWETWDYSYYNPNSNASRRGFRLGYVALLSDGTRQYFTDDSIHCTGTSKKTEVISFTVPENTEQMWLVVSPSPSKYIQHQWDEDFYDDDDVWPYQVKFTGTDIGSDATVYMEPTIDGRDISDVTITYDVYFAASSSSYDGVDFSLNGKEIAALGTAFQLTQSEIVDAMVEYSSAGPGVGEIMFYGVHANGNLAEKASTANGYGHWFTSGGNVTTYSSGYLYSEFTPSSMSFAIGQYPGKLKDGNDYTISQALKYKQSNSATALATFVFNIHITDEQTGASLASIVSESDDATGITIIRSDDSSTADGGVYSISGVKVSDANETDDPLEGLSPGIYIMNGKKVIVR